MIFLVQLGTIDYATGLALQQQLVALRKEAKIADVLLLLEHSPVITLGRNAKAANVVASRDLLAQRGIELFECDRGGDVTFHGPGQIVGYPIFDLRGYARTQTNPSSSPNPSPLSSRAKENDSLANRSLQSRDLGVTEERPSTIRKTLGVIEFVRRLEEVVIRTCADFAVPAKRIAGLTGVWTDPETSQHKKTLSFRAEQEDSLANLPAESRNLLSAGATTHPESKLAAIGVHVSRFVTSHGFALNVNTDLSYFSLIVPCGITSKPVTSMKQELGRPLDLTAVAESISRNFGVVFQSQILWLESLDALLASSDHCSTVTH